MKAKNVIILKSVIKFNALKIHKGGIVRIPDYLINQCLFENKKLVVTFNHKPLVTYESNDIINNIISVENKDFQGHLNGKPLTYKLVILNADKNSK